MRFRVSTWNCFGQGQGLSAVTARRAPLAARLRHESVFTTCAESDVVCVQELFSRDAQVFFDGLARYGFDTTFRDHNRIDFRSGTFRGTGLGVGSRARPVEMAIRHFPPPRVGWDKLARKGAIHTRNVLAHDLTLDIVTAHLQAGCDAAARDVRMRQLEDVAALIDRIGDEHPFVVCGDFNICGLASARGEDEYLRLRQSLPGFEDLGAESDLPTLDARPDSNKLARLFEAGPIANRVDYVFFRPAGRGPARVEVTSLERFFDRPLPFSAPHEGAVDPTHYASDHFGLTATLSF